MEEVRRVVGFPPDVAAVGNGNDDPQTVESGTWKSGCSPAIQASLVVVQPTQRADCASIASSGTLSLSVRVTAKCCRACAIDRGEGQLHRVCQAADCGSLPRTTQSQRQRIVLM